MGAPKGNQYAKGNGRPSLYSEAYDNEVVECGARGLSLTAFAGEIGVCRDTITEWKSKHKSFSLACKKAQAKRTLFLEGGMLKVDATGPMVTARRFALANAAPDEWREKTTHEHGGIDGEAIKTETAVSIYQLPDNGRTTTD